MREWWREKKGLKLGKFLRHGTAMEKKSDTEKEEGVGGLKIAREMGRGSE